MARDILEAAKRVADMDDEEIQLFAKRDPDIFRDIARKLRADYDVDQIAVLGSPLEARFLCRSIRTLKTSFWTQKTREGLLCLIQYRHEELCRLGSFMLTERKNDGWPK